MLFISEGEIKEEYIERSYGCPYRAAFDSLLMLEFSRSMGPESVKRSQCHRYTSSVSMGLLTASASHCTTESTDSSSPVKFAVPIIEALSWIILAVLHCSLLVSSNLLRYDAKGVRSTRGRVGRLPRSIMVVYLISNS